MTNGVRSWGEGICSGEQEEVCNVRCEIEDFVSIVGRTIGLDMDGGKEQI